MSSKNRNLLEFPDYSLFSIHTIPYAQWGKIITIVTGQEEELSVSLKKNMLLHRSSIRSSLLLNFFMSSCSETKISNLLPFFCSGNLLNFSVRSDLCANLHCLATISLYNKNNKKKKAVGM